MASVQAVNARKSFGALEVLRGVNIEVDDGTFTALVGPSGCGKSTLLRMIAGLETITGGEIMIGNDVVNRKAPKERDIAMVFQNYALYPHLNVSENMSFSLSLKGASKAVIRQKVDQAAQILGLQPYLDRYPRQLSGGQRQRVAMGRAIVRDPQVFLFDEPLSNLDAKLRVAMRAEIKTLHQTLKTTTLYVTHDQIEAMTMADRIVVMKDGLVSQVGKPLDLYDTPANAFVASFIGSPAMNLLKGTIVENASGLAFVGPGGCAFPIDPRFACRPGEQVIYGVRPEHMSLGGDIRARVLIVEPTGSETTLLLEVGGASVTLVVRDRVSVGRGDMVALSISDDRTHLFDASTELRLKLK
ncbi:sugar ABC transporter ATP-binding protein (plasmid) [Microvirga ossetica]|uniref:Sugar ABC transporter ATP-binding protein n=1 Tax=Microvirga ossetica TaxID=1882682 RepID=A0A1B2EVW2_9HYPH|nr:sn-glycerol-3-phosphate ABC transporter ATP-binding protein UgpC [Microvirga ossetica]ANY84094.1 sugar ABC transporter ATP-binding protein [Microvirga ossetica]